MILSITLGTHSLHAAIFDGSRITPITESYDRGDFFPTCVYLNESDELLFGEDAENQRHCDPTRYRRELTRYLGQDTPVVLGDRTFLTEDLFVAIFKYLKSKAEKTIARTVDKIVISLSATDGEYRKTVINRVAKYSGFSSVTIVQESVASAHYYEYINQDSVSEGDIILIYDLGGSTFSATLVQKIGETFQLLAQPMVDSNLGGANFDRLIFQDFIDKHGKALRDVLERQDREALKIRLEIANQCRDIKHYLSQKTEYQGKIKDYANYNLSRQEFESLISCEVRNTLELCQQLIQANSLDRGEINQVFMIGGSSHIPYIKNCLEREFSMSIFRLDRPELTGCLGNNIYLETQNINPKLPKLSNSIRNEDPSQNRQPNIKKSESDEPFDWFYSKSTSLKTNKNATHDWF